jgi:Ca2+-binding RTX toxin-like protein
VPIVEEIDIDWYGTGTGKGIALTAVFGAVSIRAIVPGVGDVRYTRYPDGTEEIYKLSNDPYEHVNRLDFRTGKGLTAADNALHNTVRGLMQDRLAEEGILLSDGIAPIQGTTADELIVGTSGSGVNVLRGGGGDDTYVVYKQSTIVEDAGRGFDAIVLQNATLEKTFNLPANVEMIQVSKFFTGNAADNWIFAGGNAGTLNGMGGNDTIRTGAGRFLVDGGEGNDRLLGDNGADTIVGGSGNDTITGEDNADDLSGGKGADVITGDAGNDKLEGNAGADVLTGGTGSDLFIVSTATDSAGATADRIRDFEGAGAAAGDRIDLAAIDAHAGLAGNQAFSWNKAGAGTLRAVEEGGNTVLFGNTDSDTAYELRIVLVDGQVAAVAYTADDFAL